MAESPPFRSGHISVLLPIGTPDHEVPLLVRRLVVDALAVKGEWPTRIRIRIVASHPADEDGMKRWFAEYETRAR
jgi:hypothetical protein